MFSPLGGDAGGREDIQTHHSKLITQNSSLKTPNSKLPHFFQKALEKIIQKVMISSLPVIIHNVRIYFPRSGM